ncbi:MAG: alpha-hydroxy-acid oxidizing protein [Mobilibacterium timonense]|uniref:glutamate synthase-related protein n=1 Tax=Mobilibacterium timonense TaxID=1871012 RepID=UPI0023533F1D|nr:glutamate synthase-related protein [Mobilibacterium timonense]MBM6990444.1 alpha-hydroxy-acid oxidizing protein [Mobilibacterium timonense]
MKKYRCLVCGAIFEVGNGETPVCPVCGAKGKDLELLSADGENESEVRTEDAATIAGAAGAAAAHSEDEPDLNFTAPYERHDDSIPHMDDIHRMAVTGEPISGAMATDLPLPKWDYILILGGQLAHMPLENDEPVSTTTVIGKNAKKPMILGSPVYVTHMSFGALSKEAKVALSRGSAMARTAMCSGEGGILPEEMAAAYKYIFEYVPNRYSVTDENLKNADAIEIKIGQGTKPGMGGHLPGEKVTPEIARIRGKKEGEDVQSPSRFPGINSRDDLKALVSEIRSRSDGRPVGVKIAAGHIEEDLDFILYAKPDFITIDGRGGATGSSPKHLRDATSVPTIYALSRARKFLDQRRSDVELVITGGLRISSDIAKALAMGADAVAIGTAAMIAAGCQQYRICGSGKCPVGIATQDPELRKRFDEDAAAQRVGNFLNATKAELRTFARVTGHRSIHDLTTGDLITLDRDIAELTGIKRG